ncbi:MAG: hypothetical protein AB8F34_12975 [Akkermansiaceae bacterium]
MPKKVKKKVASKKAVKNTQDKSKQSKAPKSKGRGKRYTPEQKAKVLGYVDEVNAKKGRGGAAAASRKFGISQITIGQWVKKSGSAAPAKKGAKPGPKPGAKRGRKPAAAKGGSSFAATLRRLADVHESIAAKKAELSSLEQEYAKLKKGL